jgi:hypothetical protein
MSVLDVHVTFGIFRLLCIITSRDTHLNTPTCWVRMARMTPILDQEQTNEFYFNHLDLHRAASEEILHNMSPNPLPPPVLSD